MGHCYMKLLGNHADFSEVFSLKHQPNQCLCLLVNNDLAVSEDLHYAYPQQDRRYQTSFKSSVY